MTDTGSYGVPLSTARRLSRNLEDYDTSRFYAVLADLHGDLPREWMIQPDMAISECPGCGSEHIGQEGDTQFCHGCAAHWPYNEPERTHYPGSPFGGEQA
ncbi:hypothetical protein [Haloarcula argentinensis]|uniref:Uncharacterized protein n=1 Tax=Haloarcula argentinensis TaxID=43776 RepID=A0ABU2EY89_HALAR|nr:hypothetical protein [Haloarcula argentinensis]EMA24649.1 hypothetical protein C443_05804 [Haloarcula argentinensis DSM 12282]MDS0253233.1 hypothetical protein [Haloarcula argentinensis]